MVPSLSPDVQFASCMKNVLKALEVGKLKQLLENSHELAREEAMAIEQSALGL